MNLIELTNRNQTELYGHDKIFNEILGLYKKKKLPKKIILSGPKGIGKSTLAYHLTNYIFSLNEENKYDLKNFKIDNMNKSFSLVKNNSHPNFYLIDIDEGKKNIEINQIRKMINFCNKSSFNNEDKIILIDNLEKLNTNSVNALLKIVEEPNDNIQFILINNSNKYILETLKSRCIKFNLFLNFNKTIEVTNKIININIYEKLNLELINYYNSPGHYIQLINFSVINNINLKEFSLKFFLKYLIENSFYKKDLFISDCIYQYLEFYLNKLINKNNSHKINILYKKITDKVFNMRKYNLDQESFFIELRSNLFHE